MNYWSKYQGTGLEQKINAYLCLHLGIKSSSSKQHLELAKEISSLPCDLLTFRNMEDFVPDVCDMIERLKNQNKIKVVDEFIAEFLRNKRVEDEDTQFDIIMTLSWGVTLLILTDKMSCEVSEKQVY